MPYIVGIDFDNTLVDYDDVMHHAAVRSGFIGVDTPRSKRNIRDEIRRLPDGEMKWRKLQAFVYAEAMDEARLMEGVRDFFDLCKRAGIRIYIVSHKMEFAAADEKGINLRRVAMGWMDKQRFFDDDGLGLSRQDVYFEMTRKEKVERIKELGCTHFIDDLEETFQEISFPRDVQKFLYAPHNGNVSSRDVRVSRTWDEIREYFGEQKR